MKRTTKPTLWKDWRIWVALCLVLAIASSFIFRDSASFNDVISTFKRFPPWALVSALFLSTLQVLGMGFRIRALAPKGTRLYSVLWAVSYGQFANAFFPARAGDALKIAILSDKKNGAGLSIAGATGVLVGDRPVDIGALLLWVAISGSYTVPAFQSEKMPSFSNILIVAFFSFLVIGGLFRFVFRDRFPNLRKKLIEFGRSASVFLNFRHGAPAVICSLFSWLCEFMALLLLAHSIGYPLTFSEVVAVIVLLNLAIALPISVANVGPFEAAMTYALTKLGLPTSTAISIAILHHAFQVLGTCFSTGLLFVMRRFV